VLPIRSINCGAFFDVLNLTSSATAIVVNVEAGVTPEPLEYRQFSKALSEGALRYAKANLLQPVTIRG
jgi:hypothetical protein